MTFRSILAIACSTELKSIPRYHYCTFVPPLQGFWSEAQGREAVPGLRERCRAGRPRGQKSSRHRQCSQTLHEAAARTSTHFPTLPGILTLTIRYNFA